MDTIKIANNSDEVVNFSAINGEIVTPSDTETFDRSQIFVGTGGDIAVRFINNPTSVVFKNVPDGTFMPITVIAILSTGTTALNIVLIR